ncbi:MAG TPA: Tim44-like domain-containing protein [Burkholderiales bacterium]|nr:Tim44-like domain-containing protein [Burkholderiales bacterium]
MSRNSLLLGLAMLLGMMLTPLAADAQVGGALVAQGSVITAQSATPAPAGTPARPAPPPVRSRGWMPVIGTLAAGGLLGALFGGNALFGILMVALVVALGVYVTRLILRTRGEDTPAAQFAGLGSETVAAPPPSQPTESGAPATAARRVQSGPRLPEGFDLPGFLRAAKLNFVRLQIANDVGRLEEIREFAAPPLYAALVRGAVERGAKALHTDVVSLNAELTALATEGEMQRASVRFNGMVREAPGAAPSGFAELWQFSRPVDGSTGWLLDGIRQVE